MIPRLHNTHLPTSVLTHIFFIEKKWLWSVGMIYYVLNSKISSNIMLIFSFFLLKIQFFNKHTRDRILQKPFVKPWEIFHRDSRKSKASCHSTGQTPKKCYNISTYSLARKNVDSSFWWGIAKYSSWPDHHVLLPNSFFSRYYPNHDLNSVEKGTKKKNVSFLSIQILSAVHDQLLLDVLSSFPV